MIVVGQKINAIARVYDTVAKAYADHFRGEHEKKPQDQKILRRFVKEVGDNRPVWDFGCGPGHTARYLQKEGLEVAGLDLSAKILDQAKSIHPEISFRQANILDLDFEEGSIAAVLSFYAIVHFSKDQVSQALDEIFRVLKPDGLLLITFHIGDETIGIEEFLGKKIAINFMFFTSEFIAGCLQRTGFVKIELIERAPYPDVEYQSRRAYVFARKPAKSATLYR